MPVEIHTYESYKHIIPEIDTKGNYKDILGRLQIHLNSYEEATIDRFEFKDAVLLDIGAYYGLWSIIALLNGAKHVIAFECNPTFLYGFSYRLEELGNKLITFYGLLANLKALGKKYESKWSCYNAVVTAERYLEEGGFKTTIDNFLQSYPNTPTIMKIDVEGMEMAVLDGAKKTIERYKPRLMIESHDYIHPGQTDEILSILKSWDYQSQIKPLYDGRGYHIITPISP